MRNNSPRFESNSLSGNDPGSALSIKETDNRECRDSPLACTETSLETSALDNEPRHRQKSFSEPWLSASAFARTTRESQRGTVDDAQWKKNSPYF